ncbi:MAG: hypothetical protein ACI89X_000475, partial [Planctomycetota bacterium]
MRCQALACFSAVVLLAQAAPSQSDAPKSDAEQSDAEKSIQAFTKDMQHLPGFVAMHVDRKTDRIYFELSAFEQELLYATAQASG